MTRNSDGEAVKINDVELFPDVQQARFHLSSDANVDEAFTLTIGYACAATSPQQTVLLPKM